MAQQLDNTSPIALHSAAAARPAHLARLPNSHKPAAARSCLMHHTLQRFAVDQGFSPGPAAVHPLPDCTQLPDALHVSV